MLTLLKLDFGFQYANYDTFALFASPSAPFSNPPLQPSPSLVLSSSCRSLALFRGCLRCLGSSLSCFSSTCRLLRSRRGFSGFRRARRLLRRARRGSTHDTSISRAWKVQLGRRGDVRAEVLRGAAATDELRSCSGDVRADVTANQRHDFLTLRASPRHIDVVHVADQHLAWVAGARAVRGLVALVDNYWQSALGAVEVLEGDVLGVTVPTTRCRCRGRGAAESLDARAVRGVDHGDILDEHVLHDILGAGVLA
jgi:hypothetical protein